MDSLDLLTQQNLKSLALQRDHVEVLQAKMRSCLEYAEGGLETGTEGELLEMRAPVLRWIEQIKTEFDLATLEPQTEADIELVTDGLEQVSQACREFGEVVSGPLSAENSYTTGNGSKYATIGEQTSVELHAMTRRNKRHAKKLNLTAELVHTKSRATIECEVKEENGQHTINYQPAKRGKHSLHIRINGEHIRGSPYPIAITPSPQSLLKPIRVVSGLTNRSFGTTTNSKGQIVVVETNGHCISVLTPEGEKIRTFGREGSGEGQLNVPCGVAVDRHDNIYVVDTNNYRIQNFTSDGKFVAAVGCPGRNCLQFDRPTGICFNKSNNNLYVCEHSNHRIQVLSTDLTFVRCFGTKGSGDGQFQHPLCAAFDDANNLYVTDYYNHRVQVFTAEGHFVRTFTNKANGEQLQSPFAIAIDSSNTVYVSEDDRHCVSVFTTQGEYITSFGTKGTDEGQFNEVCGLSVDQNDSIIVSDHDKGRLQIF